MKRIVWEFNNLPEMPGPFSSQEEEDQMENCNSEMGRRGIIQPPFPTSLHEERGRPGGTAVASPRQESAGSHEFKRYSLAS